MPGQETATVQTAEGQTEARPSSSGARVVEQSLSVAPFVFLRTIEAVNRHGFSNTAGC